MLLKQGTFAAFLGNYMQESDLGLSSSVINKAHLSSWGFISPQLAVIQW